MAGDHDPGPLLDRLRQLEAEAAECRARLAALGEAAGGGLRLLELECDGRTLGVPVAAVREVVGMARPEPLPDAPAWVTGTVPYGERTIPVVDLRRRLGGEPAPPSPDHLLVIVDAPSWLALMVERAGRVREVPVGALEDAPADLPGAGLVVGLHRLEGARSLAVLSVARLAHDVGGDATAR